MIRACQRLRYNFFLDYLRKNFLIGSQFQKKHLVQASVCSQVLVCLRKRRHHFLNKETKKDLNIKPHKKRATKTQRQAKQQEKRVQEPTSKLSHVEKKITLFCRLKDTNKYKCLKSWYPQRILRAAVRYWPQFEHIALFSQLSVSEKRHNAIIFN